MKRDEELWGKTLALLKERVSYREYNTWFEYSLTFVRFNKAAGILNLEVPTDLHQKKISLKYLPQIERAALEVFGEAVTVRLTLPGAPGQGKTPIRIIDEEGEIIFNPQYTFDNFIVGPNSQFAAKAAQVVAQAPGQVYSPLFIYGKPGLGKTHLINAIGIYIREHFPKLKVLFVSSETFTEDFVNAAMHKKVNAFKEKYRSVDVLLIDDIHFISEKEKTIEEVFHTYNTLYNSGKQMVFTSDKPPKEILGVDERLQSRLEAGLVVDLQPPSYEIKAAILKKKAALKGVPEDREGLSEVISFIAESVLSNGRELEGALNRVLAFSEFTEKPLNKALARQTLTDIVKGGSGSPSVKDIKKVIAGHYGVSIADIDSDERTRTVAIPRQIAMYLTRELTGLSFPKVADAFGKDYSTVHHAFNKIKKDIEKDEKLRKVIEGLTEKIHEDY